MHTDCSQDITELAKALLNVQRTMQPALKDSNNPFTKSTYASLKSVMDSCREALLDNGIWLCQYPVPVETPGCIGLMTKLTHAESGQFQSSLTITRLPKPDPQGMGSAITYSRRYALTAMLGMVTEDDDGESAKAPTKSSGNSTKNPAKRPIPQQKSTRETEYPQNLDGNSTNIDNLPQLDGISYQIVAAQDGRDCIVATGNTIAQKKVLSDLGFRWNAQRKCWWKYADVA